MVAQEERATVLFKKSHTPMLFVPSTSSIHVVESTVDFTKSSSSNLTIPLMFRPMDMSFIICHNKYSKDVSPQFFYCFYSTGLLLVPQKHFFFFFFFLLMLMLMLLLLLSFGLLFPYQVLLSYWLLLPLLLSSWLLDPVVEDDGVPHWFL